MSTLTAPPVEDFPIPRCPVHRALRAARRLDDGSLEALRTLVTDHRYPARVVAETINAAPLGVEIGFYAVGRHRRHKCACTPEVSA